MSILYRCDRCGIDKVSTTMDAGGHGTEGTFLVYPPTGWERVCGTMLCEKCASELHQFLRPIPTKRSFDSLDAIEAKVERERLHPLHPDASKR